MMKKKSSAFHRKRINGEVLTLHQASRSPILSIPNGTEPGYVVNLKRTDSYKLKVWAVHFLTFENFGQNYDVL